ncbi:MAG: DUF4214 domain-containing protein, partial [Betaproteobacteria bacterium]|nr:DUF4214 domain-containing protein [Betaproteobacteria bacterium]
MATLTVYKLPSNYDGERQTATYDPPFPLNEGTTTTYREVSKSGHVTSITVKVFQTYFEATRFQVAEPDGSIDYVWEGLTKVDVNVGWSSFFANYMAGDDLIIPASSMRSSGQAGNDTLQSSTGIDVFDGGDGIDTAVFEKARSAYKTEKLVQDGTTLWKVTDLATGDVDELRNIEKLEFAVVSSNLYQNPLKPTQTEINLDTTGTAAVAYRVYKAAFAREPDFEGLGYWVSVLDQYLDPKLSPEKNPFLLDIAKTFVESSEFKTKYGKDGKDVANDGYVLNLYLNALGRDPRIPDAQGKLDPGYPYWVDVLNKNNASRSDLFVYFSESAENKAAVA